MIARTMLAILIAAAPTVAAARCWRPGENVSWYGEPQRLPDGSAFDPEAETCASREYPKGSVLRVTDLDTGMGVECAVNDWGPGSWTRCKVDLSRKAAIRLGIFHRGVARAKIEVISAVWPQPPRQALQDAPKQKIGTDIAAGAD